MDNEMQIVILIIILICLIAYFFDILGSDEYNYQVKKRDENFSYNNNVKDVKNLTDEDYINGRIKSISNFDKKRFEVTSVKVLNIVFKYLQEMKIDKLKDLIDRALFSDIASCDFNNLGDKAKEDKDQNDKVYNLSLIHI